MSSSLTIVLPTLDEEAALRRNLPAALRITDRVVVSDGGSRDRTRQVAEELGVRVVTGPPGRGGQLNRGAAAADTPLLLFLHADSRLPDGAAEAVRRAAAAGAVGGGFYVRFEDERRIMRLGTKLVNLRTRHLRIPLGDQGQFAARSAFEALGGFRDWPILEDLDFMRRLKRHGEVAIIRLPVVTSARRFRAGGIPRTVATNWLIWLLFFAGVSPLRLGRLYQHLR